jgi:hypothetical protein
MKGYLTKKRGLIKAEVRDNFGGIMEYGNSGKVRNIGFGGPRSVMAGRDRARPSKNELKHPITPLFHYSSSLGV